MSFCGYSAVLLENACSPTLYWKYFRYFTANPCKQRVLQSADRVKKQLTIPRFSTNLLEEMVEYRELLPSERRLIELMEGGESLEEIKRRILDEGRDVGGVDENVLN